MADLISNSLAVSPTALFALGRINPVALQSLSAETATTVSALIANASSSVEVSETGQLLSALSSFQEALAALQKAAAENDPEALLALAKSLVDAFNELQGNISTLLTASAALPQSLDDLVIGAIEAGGSSLANLEAIGIELQAAAAGGLTLTLDEEVFNAALAANPEEVLALLNQATESLLDRLAELEAQVVSTAVLQVDLTQLGGTGGEATSLGALLGLTEPTAAGEVTVPTELLQLLSADTALNNVGLTDLDLAAAGVTPSTVLTTTGVLETSLEETLLAATGTPVAIVETEVATLAGTEAGATATPTLAAQPAPTPAPTVVAPELAGGGATVIPTPTAAAQVVAAPGAVLTGDAIAAERRAAEAAQALQRLLNDPTRRAINNNRFDPAYSAMIAASHLSDFVAPMPGTNTGNLPADIPGGVMPIVRVRAIAAYNAEATRAEMGG